MHFLGASLLVTRAELEVITEARRTPDLTAGTWLG
jgi:hypothetical protein